MNEVNRRYRRHRSNCTIRAQPTIFTEQEYKKHGLSRNTPANRLRFFFWSIYVRELRWEVIMEQYIYDGGFFLSIGNFGWQEWQNNILVFHFNETERNSDWITLNDTTRNIWVMLPINGGMSYYAYGGASNWTELYDVTKTSTPDTNQTKTDIIIEKAIAEMRGERPLRVPSESELDNYFTGCGSAFTQYDRTVSWCGIFATYILRKTGLRVKWRIGKGIENEPGCFDIQFVRGNAGVSTGDIAVRGTGYHHFILLEQPANQGAILAVDGNAGGIEYPQLRYDRWWKNSLSAINCYYKIL